MSIELGLKEKVAIVTGAGGGIGRRFSVRLPDRLHRSGTLESDLAGTDPGTL